MSGAWRLGALARIAPARTSHVRRDSAVFEAVYRSSHDALSRYVHSIVRDPHAVEDVLQSTMVRALSALQTEQRDFELRPWLFRIAHNEAISRIRREKPTEELGDAMGAPVASAGAVAEQRQEIEQLWQDLARLGERQRQALVLRELSGLGHEEIATVLGTSARAVKQTIFEARRGVLECAEGRAMQCDDVQRTLSDGDGRIRRGRKMQAHLADCAACQLFDAALTERPRQLAMLAPALPLALSGSLLASVLPGVHGAAIAAGGTSAASTGAVAAAGTSLGGVLAGKAAVLAATGVVAAGAAGAVVVKSTGGGGAAKERDHGSQVAPSGQGGVQRPGGVPASAIGAGAAGGTTPSASGEVSTTPAPADRITSTTGADRAAGGNARSDAASANGAEASAAKGDNRSAKAGGAGGTSAAGKAKAKAAAKGKSAAQARSAAKAKAKAKSDAKAESKARDAAAGGSGSSKKTPGAGSATGSDAPSSATKAPAKAPTITTGAQESVAPAPDAGSAAAGGSAGATGTGRRPETSSAPAVAQK